MTTKFDKITDEIRNRIIEIVPNTDNSIKILVENDTAPKYDIQLALGKIQKYVIIGVSSFNRASRSGPMMIGQLAIDIICAEGTPVQSVINPSDDRLTEQDIAYLITTNLHWNKLESTDTPIRFQSMQRTDSEDLRIMKTSWIVDVGLENAEYSPL